MKKFLIQSFLLLFVIIGGLIFLKVSETKTINVPFVPQPEKKATLKINDSLLKIEIADSKEKRNKGLSNREKIASDEGMLFVFERPDKYVFWMKGLSFPLDFIWINNDTVVDLLENIPQPTSGQSDSSLPVYSAREPINKVLEVNAGIIKVLNIKVGDKIQIINP